MERGEESGAPRPRRLGKTRFGVFPAVGAAVGAFFVLSGAPLFVAVLYASLGLAFGAAHLASRTPPTAEELPRVGRLTDGSVGLVVSQVRLRLRLTAVALAIVLASVTLPALTGLLDQVREPPLYDLLRVLAVIVAGVFAGRALLAARHAGHVGLSDRGVEIATSKVRESLAWDSIERAWAADGISQSPLRIRLRARERARRGAWFRARTWLRRTMFGAEISVDEVLLSVKSAPLASVIQHYLEDSTARAELGTGRAVERLSEALTTTEVTWKWPP